MKFTKFGKVLMALAIAGAAYTPVIEKSYADTEVSMADYVSKYNDLKKLVGEANKLKTSYKYINSSAYSKQNLDNGLAKAQASLDKYKQATEEPAALSEISNSANYLREAMNQLDGKKTDSSELTTLVLDDSEFVKTDAYKNASEALKSAYTSAYSHARQLLLKDADKLSYVDTNVAIAELKDARKNIEDAYAPSYAKAELKEEIKKSNDLRNKRNSYTKASFDSFIAALKLAETSIEDKSSAKTATEYKELKDSLVKAREALVEKNNDKVEEQIARLKEAIDTNQISVEAGQFLLDSAPKQVEHVKDKLVSLIEKSKKDIDKANKMIKTLRGIKG